MERFELYSHPDGHGIAYEADRRQLVTVSLDDLGNTFSVRIPVGPRGLADLAEKIRELCEVLK